MKVEVGDWVKLRGMRRIYEVSEVNEAREIGTMRQTIIRVHGNPAPQLAEHVEQIAPKFWIRKERMR